MVAPYGIYDVVAEGCHPALFEEGMRVQDQEDRPAGRADVDDFETRDGRPPRLRIAGSIRRSGRLTVSLPAWIAFGSGRGIGTEPGTRGDRGNCVRLVIRDVPLMVVSRSRLREVTSLRGGERLHRCRRCAVGVRGGSSR
jgi:hypothetical protein